MNATERDRRAIGDSNLGTGTPPEYRHYRVLDEFVLSSEDDERRGIHRAVQLVKPPDGPLEIRVCYYTRRRKADGSEWWGLSPRPPHFPPDEARRIAQGIIELADKCKLIADSAGDGRDGGA